MVWMDISYLLLCSKLSQNLQAQKNKYYLPQILSVGSLGEAQLSASGCLSLEIAVQVSRSTVISRLNWGWRIQF